jgi:hypothetical protein
MNTNQKEFLFMWAKLCKRDSNKHLHCAVTIWDYKSDCEKMEIAVKNKKLEIPKSEIDSWWIFFKEKIDDKTIKALNVASSGTIPITMIGVDYVFTSQMVIDEISER